MEAFRGKFRYGCATHRPRLHGRVLSARRHLPELVDGYVQATRLLRSNGKRADQWRAGIADLQRMETRLIHRPTLLYLALIRSSLQPHLLTAGVDRSIALQALPQGRVGSAVRRAEIAALEGLDVPYFSKKREVACSAPAEFVADEPDLASQVAAIRWSLQGNAFRRKGSAAAHTWHRRERAES